MTLRPLVHSILSISEGNRFPLSMYIDIERRQVFGPVAVRPVVLAIERQQRSATPRRCPPPTRRRCAGGAGAHKTTINHTSVGVRGREEDMLAAEGRNRDQKRSWEDDMMPSRRRLLFIYHLDGARSRRPASGCAQNKTTINSVHVGGKRRGQRIPPAEGFSATDTLVGGRYAFSSGLSPMSVHHD